MERMIMKKKGINCEFDLCIYNSGRKTKKQKNKTTKKQQNNKNTHSSSNRHQNKVVDIDMIQNHHKFHY